MTEKDTVLVVGIKKGDTQSFRKLYDRYHQQLYYVAKQYLKDQSLAKDAVQDVFLKFWEKKDTLDKSLSVKCFLFTMLKNHVINMIRKQKNRRKVIEEVKRTVQNRELKNVVEEEIIYSECQKNLKRALVKLSPAKREVFESRSFEGLTNSEIAAKRDVSEHTVKTQYYLGSKFIRTYLKKYACLFITVIPALVSLIGG